MPAKRPKRKAPTRKAAAKAARLKSGLRKLARKGSAVRGRAKDIAPPAKGSLIATLPKVTRLQFTANSQAILLARAGKKTLTLWDIASASETPPLKALPTFTAVALSADNRLIAMGTSTGIIAVESPQTGKFLWKTKAGGDAISDLGFTLDASLIVAAGQGWVRIHKAHSGEPDAAFEPVEGAQCPHIAFSPDGLFMAHSEIRSNSVLVWHLPTRQMATCIRLTRVGGTIVRLGFGPTVRQLYIAQQRQISGWNAENGTSFIEFQVEEGECESLAVIEQGNVLAVTRAGARPALDIWSSATGRLRRSISLPDIPRGPLAASPDGRLLALPTERDCWLWNAEKLAAI